MRSEIMDYNNETIKEKIANLDRLAADLSKRLDILEAIEREREEQEVSRRSYNNSNSDDQSVLLDVAGDFGEAITKKVYRRMQDYYAKKGYKMPYGWKLKEKLAQWIEREGSFDR